MRIGCVLMNSEEIKEIVPFKFKFPLLNNNSSTIENGSGPLNLNLQNEETLPPPANCKGQRQRHHYCHPPEEERFRYDKAFERRARQSCQHQGSHQQKLSHLSTSLRKGKAQTLSACTWQRVSFTMRQDYGRQLHIWEETHLWLLTIQANQPLHLLLWFKVLLGWPQKGVTDQWATIRIHHCRWSWSFVRYFAGQCSLNSKQIHSWIAKKA